MRLTVAQALLQAQLLHKEGAGEADLILVLLLPGAVTLALPQDVQAEPTTGPKIFLPNESGSCPAPSPSHRH